MSVRCSPLLSVQLVRVRLGPDEVGKLIRILGRMTYSPLAGLDVATNITGVLIGS